MTWAGFNWLRIESLVNTVTKLLAPLKTLSFCDQLNDCQLLSKDSCTWNLAKINFRWHAVMFLL